MAKSRNCPTSISGMQGAENEMPSLCRLNSKLGCSGISNLPDHDDIRVLPKKGANDCWKIQACPGVIGYLVDSSKTNFNGVFYRAKIAMILIELTQAAIERSSLAAPSWPGH